MNILQRTRKNLTKAVRSCDQYGKKFELTYKNQSSFKTTFGGLMTLLAFSSLTFYFIFLFVCIVEHGSVRFNYTQYFRNMVFDKTEYVIDFKDFDLSVFLLYNGPDPTVQEDIDTYFSTQITQVTSREIKSGLQEGDRTTFSFEQTPLELERCQSFRLGGREAQGNIVDGNSKLCAKEFKLKIQGSIGTQEREFLSSMITYCRQEVLSKLYPNKTCKTMAESESIMPQVFAVQIHMESFFDAQEFNNSPIKKTLNTYPMEMLPNRSQVFYFKVSQNQATMNDNWVSSSIHSKTEYYYKSRLFTTSQSHSYDRVGVLLNVQYFMDETVENIERSTDTIIDAFSQIGGLMGFVTFIFSFVTQYFQEVMYKSHMIFKLYKYYDNISNPINLIDKQEGNQHGISNFKLPRFDKQANSSTTSKDNSSENSENKRLNNPKQKFKDSDSRKSFVKEKIKNQSSNQNRIQQLLVFSLLKLKSFKYSIKDALLFQISKLMPCLFKDKSSLKNQMTTYIKFQNGVKKFDKNLEISQLISTHRKVKAFEAMFLNKEQKSIIKNFKEVIDEDKEKIKKFDLSSKILQKSKNSILFNKNQETQSLPHKLIEVVNKTYEQSNSHTDKQNNNLTKNLLNYMFKMGNIDKTQFKQNNKTKNMDQIGKMDKNRSLLPKIKTQHNKTQNSDIKLNIIDNMKISNDKDQDQVYVYEKMQ